MKKYFVVIILITCFLISDIILAKSEKKSARRPASPIMLDYIPCQDQVFDILFNWSQFYDWRKDLDYEGVKSVKSPSDSIGTWIKLKVEGGLTELKKISPKTITRIQLQGPACNPQIHTTPFQPREDAFTDSKLQAILENSKKKGTSGFIYSYSSRMKLSLKGMEEAKDVAKHLGIEIHLVQDSHSVESNKIQSIELIERGIETHYPSILFYKKGILEGHVRPGYDEPSRLKEVLKRKMEL